MSKLAGVKSKSSSQQLAHFQSPRVSFFWITLAQIVCTIPHLWHIPSWVVGLCAWCIFWRVMVFQGRWSYPSKYIRYAFVILAVFALMLYFPTLLNIRAAISLLIITYYMKLLEMFRQKDIYIILILSYFVIAAAFLFQESLIMLVYFIVAFFLTTIALLTSNRTETQLNAGGNFRKGALLCLQAAPIGLCLFLFFPRFPPFWSLDIKKEGPSVGISETMSPADVAELGAAEGVAFRAEFEGALPPAEDRYWRVLTLSSFDGQNWQSLYSSLEAKIYFESKDMQSQLATKRQAFKESYRYRISLEPTEQQWLPTLDRPLSLNRSATTLPDFSMVVEQPISSLIGYAGVSAPRALLDPEINAWVRQQNLSLPPSFNPQTSAFAQKHFQRLDGNTTDYINFVMQQFRQEEFFYTLKPGRYGVNMIDEFLFERRKGFCAHYAAAMTVLLRAVGIPARVVIGYHGGEVNPLGGHIVVNNYDAHAWVEAWEAGVGWVRYDPTGMVAPWRLILGVEQMLRQTDSSEVPSLRNSLLRSNPLTNQIRLLFDYTNFRWNKYVVNFDQNSQQELLEEFFDRVDLKTMVLMMAGTVGGCLALLALLLLWQSRAQAPCKADRLINSTLRLLERKYARRQSHQTLEQYCLSIEVQLSTDEKASLRTLVRLYSTYAYAPGSAAERKNVLKLLQREVYSLNRSLQHIFR